MRATNARLAGILLGLVAALPAPALAVDAATAQRLAELERRVGKLDRLMRNQLMQMLRRLDALQVDIRDLRDRTQRGSHALEQLKARQRELYLDVDRRLQALDKGSEADALAEPDGSPSDAEGADAEAASGDARSAYKQAIKLLRENRFAEASKALKGFLEAHPQSVYSDNAQYWLAESAYAAGQWQAAKTEFKALLDDYPRSDKVAGARLKLGFTHYQLGEWQQARTQLSEVTEQYPNTSAARLAKDRLERMRQEGHG